MFCYFFHEIYASYFSIEFRKGWHFFLLCWLKNVTPISHSNNAALSAVLFTTTTYILLWRSDARWTSKAAIEKNSMRQFLKKNQGVELLDIVHRIFLVYIWIHILLHKILWKIVYKYHLQRKDSFCLIVGDINQVRFIIYSPQFGHLYFLLYFDFRFLIKFFWPFCHICMIKDTINI